MSRILARADLIATVSKFTESRLLELFDVRHPERIVVIGNGGVEGFGPVPTVADAAMLQSRGLSHGSFVLFPGSLTRRKGGDLLLRAARVAHARKLGLQFVVVGRLHDSDLLAELESIGPEPAAHGVVLTGYVAKEELAVLYRHAHCTLFPSRYEGFGIPVLEALASGCPLLISAQPALLEVSAGHATVVAEDPEAVVEAIRTTDASRRTPQMQHRTWANCAERLVAAMTL